jgi:hypothetical protein
VRKELRLYLKALAGRWPGLVFFILIMVIAFTMDGR